MFEVHFVCGTIFSSMSVFFLYDNALIVITEHDFIVWFNEGQEIEESTALTRNI